MEGHHVKVCRFTKRSGWRKIERKNVNHASHKADKHVTKTSDEKLCFTQFVEKVDLLQSASERKELPINGHKLKMQKESQSCRRKGEQKWVHTA